MRFLILSRNASLYSTSRIVLAARARGHDVSVIDPLDFQIVVSRGRPALVVAGAAVPRYDIVIPRIDAYEPLGLELQDFAQAVRTGSVPRSNAALGVEIVAAMEAAETSLRRNGHPISLDGAVDERAAA